MLSSCTPRTQNPSSLTFVYFVDQSGFYTRTTAQPLPSEAAADAAITAKAVLCRERKGWDGGSRDSISKVSLQD